MENRKARYIRAIERVLNSPKLTVEQRETLARLDRFNQLEAGCGLGTRTSYVELLQDLGVCVGKPFEEMTKEDLQTYLAEESKHHKEGTIVKKKAVIKRFFTFLEWLKTNEGKPDEEKEDMKDIKPPYCVRWMKQKRVQNALEFEDLPTEEEVLKMANCISSPRNRALLLTLWETGASPIEILNLRLKDVACMHYGLIFWEGGLTTLDLHDSLAC